MDIDALDLEDTHDHTVVTAAGDPTDIVITLAGPSHPKRLEFDRRQTRRVLRQINKEGRPQAPDDPDELLREQVERLVAMTLGWRGPSRNGTPLPFTEQNAYEFYAHSKRPHLRFQLLRALDQNENFMQSSAASSSLPPNTGSAST